MKWIMVLGWLMSVALAQTCAEPIYVSTRGAIRWLPQNGVVREVPPGKTLVACDGDTLEALGPTRITYGFASARPERRDLGAGERFTLRLRPANTAAQGLGRGILEIVKGVAQKFFGSSSSPVQTASRDPSAILKRNIYSPLLALGQNRIIEGSKALVLPFAEAAAPYTLTLSKGDRVVARAKSEGYNGHIALSLAQGLAAGVYTLRLESGNGSVLLDQLEVLPLSALPATPADLKQAGAEEVLSITWLARQPGWALEAYQRAVRLQDDFPALAFLAATLNPSTPEEDQLLSELLGR